MKIRTATSLAINIHSKGRVMRRRLQRTIAVSALVSSVAAAAPGSAQVVDAAQKASPKPGAASCAAAPLPSLPGPGAGAPTPGPPGMPPMQLPMAKTIAPADASTSKVIKPDLAAQMICGKVALKAINDVTFVEAADNGGGRPLKIDILVPDGKKKRPLVIFVPGGAFLFAFKEGGLDLRTYVAEQGFVVASINYRTALDGASYADGIADVKQAIRFLRAHADEYGIDPKKVALWGESAGGYLASMVALSDGDPKFDRGANLDQSSRIQAVVDKFGPTDLSMIAADFDEDMQRAYRQPNPTIGYVGGLTPDGKLADPASDPVNHLKGSVPPPFLILHGTQDRLISPSQSLRLHNALRAAGKDSKRYLIEGGNHGDLAFFGDMHAGLYWSNTEVMRLITDYLRATLK
jgi:acetyl esterase/lipase